MIRDQNFDILTELPMIKLLSVVLFGQQEMIAWFIEFLLQVHIEILSSIRLQFSLLKIIFA